MRMALLYISFMPYSKHVFRTCIKYTEVFQNPDDASYRLNTHCFNIIIYLFQLIHYHYILHYILKFLHFKLK